VILMSHLSWVIFPLVHCITLKSHFALINLNRWRVIEIFYYAMYGGRLVPPLSSHLMSPGVFSETSFWKEAFKWSCCWKLTYVCCV
jgi:hypothetical protein